MLSFESKFVDFFKKHVFAILVVLLVAGGVALRLALFDHVTPDMDFYFLDWYAQMQQRGWAVLTFGYDYNTAFFILLYIATKLPFSAVWNIKLVMSAGDVMLAAAVAWLYITAAGGGKKQFAAAFCAAFLLPVGILNTAYWGQCDSIFIAFVVLAVALALREKWLLAFVALGLSLCFKLQAIFILPLFIILYAVKKAYTIFLYLLPPAIMYLSFVPAILVGAHPLDGIATYGRQLGWGGQGAIHLSYYNLATFFANGNNEVFSPYLLLGAMLAFVAMFCLVLYKGWDFTGEGIVLLGGWSVLTCAVLMPGMHERYAYIAEILLLVWAALKPQKQRIIPALIVYVIGFLSYSRYLFGPLAVDDRVLALISVANYGYITYCVIRTAMEGGGRAIKAAAPVPCPPRAKKKARNKKG